ncbi:MAG: 2-oxoacid:acceptor oxidoreductase family protein [Deltaproteobacteria bacterium]|nr:2-oxoacid:acceptor oxidoreductase family protein [Deltaproteobacteria bacterium]
MIQMILCGRGGQGIVFLTRLLGEIATKKGMAVISSETHGMAVRGGSINSHLKIGAFSSPLIRWGHADYLVSMDSSETFNNRHFLKQGGIVFENSLAPSASGVYRIDASGMARSLGKIQLENVVLLGFTASLADFEISLDDIKQRLDADSREMVRRYNLKALEAGANAALVHKT